MRPLALIPAKGHSERLPGKNLAPLAGRPLIRWTIDAAHAAGIFGDDVWVSSDDPEILRVAEDAGCRPLRRPTELASPSATVSDVLDHARVALEWRGPVYVLLPTSPFRAPATIQAAWERFQQERPGQLLSIVPMDHHPAWALMEHPSGIVVPIHPQLWDTPRSTLFTAWRHDGGHQIVGPGVGMLGFKVRPEEALDVNTPQDLAWAEYCITTGRVPWIANASNVG